MTSPITAIGGAELADSKGVACMRPARDVRPGTSIVVHGVT